MHSISIAINYLESPQPQSIRDENSSPHWFNKKIGPIRKLMNAKKHAQIDKQNG